MSRGESNPWQKEEAAGSNPSGGILDAQLIEFESVDEKDECRAEEKDTKLGDTSKLNEYGTSSSNEAVVSSNNRQETESAHKIAVKEARKKYRDLKANRVDAIKEAKSINESTPFEGNKMLRELSSDMKMSLGGIWVCIVSDLTRGWLIDWTECKGSDESDDDDDIGDETTRTAGSSSNGSSPSLSWGRHKYRGSKVGKAIVQWARRSLEVVLNILDADEPCRRALTQLLEMNLPGGLQWRSPPPQYEGFVAHLMSLGGKSRGRDVFYSILRNSLGFHLMSLKHGNADGERKESRLQQQPGVDHVKASSGSRLSRRLKIGAAAVGGGALLALTGGLAAPAVVAGLASIGTAIGGLGTIGVAVGGLIISASGFLAAVGTAGVAVLFGAGGASLTGFKMNKRWGDLHEFEFKDAYAESAILKSKGRAFDSWGRRFNESDPAANDRQQADDPGALELRLCVGGWIRDREDVILPWIEPDISSHENEGGDNLNRFNGHPTRQSEVYAVNWESRDLIKLGSVLRRLITDEIAKQAASMWLQATIGAAAATAMFPVWIIKYMTDLDNTWLVVRDRSSVAGEVLASAIMDSSCVGNRPVTLVGISNGARVVFKCLEILYSKGYFNSVQNVVLLGAPIAITFDAPAVGSDHKRAWRRARAVVSGRFINGYCGSDWVLGFLYRYMEWGVKVAGLSPVRGISGVENADLGKLVQRHDHYPEYLTEIMAALDILELGFFSLLMVGSSSAPTSRPPPFNAPAIEAPQAAIHKLCCDIITDQFGPAVSAVASCLLSRGPMRFPELSKYVNEDLSWPLDLRTDAKVPHPMHEITNRMTWSCIRDALMILIQHNIAVSHLVKQVQVPSQEKSGAPPQHLVLYSASPSAVVARMRFPKYMNLVQEQMGRRRPVAVHVMAEVLRRGRVGWDDLIEFAALRWREYVGEHAPPMREVKADVEAALIELVTSNVLYRVEPCLRATDQQQQQQSSRAPSTPVEASSTPEGSRGELSSPEEESPMIPDIGGGAEEDIDAADDLLMMSPELALLAGEQQPGEAAAAPTTRRRKATAAKAEAGSRKRAAADAAGGSRGNRGRQTGRSRRLMKKVDATQIEGGGVLRLNQVALDMMLVKQLAVEYVAKRMNPAAGKIFQVMLNESVKPPMGPVENTKLTDCTTDTFQVDDLLDWMTHNHETPSSSPSSPASSGIGSSASAHLNRQRDELIKYLNVFSKHQDALVLCTNAAAAAALAAAPKRRGSSKRSSAASVATATVQTGPATYRVDWKNVLAKLTEELTHTILTEKYGVVGARVYQYLLTTGYKSETIRIAERCMIDREECQMLLHRLHSEHVIKLSEVPKSVIAPSVNQQASIISFWLYYLDPPTTKTAMMELVAKAALNMRVRFRHEVARASLEERNDNEDVNPEAAARNEALAEAIDALDSGDRTCAGFGSRSLSAMLYRLAILTVGVLMSVTGDDRVVLSISSLTSRRLNQGPVPPEGPPGDWVDVRDVPELLPVTEGRRALGEVEGLKACLSDVKDMLAIGVQWIDTASEGCPLTVEELCGALESLGEEYEVLCEENGELKIVQSGGIEPETVGLPEVNIDDLSNDELVFNQWNLDEIHLAEAWQKINAARRSPREIVVAVVDTGVEYDHVDLVDVTFSDSNCSHGHNFFETGIDTRDVNGHGTHCAGIIGATINNSVGLAGIAPVKIMSLRAFDEMGKGDLLYSLKAVNYIVTQRVEVSSHSYTSDATYRTLEASMKRASDRGHLMFTAAGNDRRDITNAKAYPCAYSETVEYLFCVGATDFYGRDRLSYESNYGEFVSIAAPGVGIPSTYIHNSYRYISGTSMATPHVAGVAALLSGFGLGPADIKEVLLASVDPIYYYTGGRVKNFGKLNAAKAVELALTKPTVLPNAVRSLGGRECIAQRSVAGGAKYNVAAGLAVMLLVIINL
ncbi:DNA-directed RNA polymerase III subunit RPC3 [Perkinsus chesapeaki]|uniref:subtilisin n=1 Tax=Perkinsus chesapeaki TaxID=330153 RepID=A0A7J6MLL8_PERCH|nr:DNA-directed RNA polymerase III subunit RPC3 [Perkinsus chesapeaki]